MIYFNLDTIAIKIATEAGSKAVLDSKFKQEYLINNVTEEILTNNEFKFESYDHTNTIPIYRKENLIAYFKDTVLHLGKLE